MSESVYLTDEQAALLRHVACGLVVWVVRRSGDYAFDWAREVPVTRPVRFLVKLGLVRLPPLSAKVRLTPAGERRLVGQAAEESSAGSP